jgi:hypothetical protein
MSYYLRKPDVVEGVQWTGDNFDEIAEFCGDKINLVNYRDIDGSFRGHWLPIKRFRELGRDACGFFGREESLFVNKGDYILKMEFAVRPFESSMDQTIERFVIVQEDKFNQYFEANDACPLDGSGHCG